MERESSSIANDPRLSEFSKMSPSQHLADIETVVSILEILSVSLIRFLIIMIRQEGFYALAMMMKIPRLKTTTIQLILEMANMKLSISESSSS